MLPPPMVTPLVDIDLISKFASHVSFPPDSLIVKHC